MPPISHPHRPLLLVRLWFRLLEALSIRPDLVARHHASRGNRVRNGGDWMGAVPFYEKATSLNPSLSAIWVQLGHGYKETGRYADALIAYETAVSLIPDDADARQHYGYMRHVLETGLNPTPAPDLHQPASPADAGAPAQRPARPHPPVPRHHPAHIPFFHDLHQPFIAASFDPRRPDERAVLALGDMRTLTREAVRGNLGMSDGAIVADQSRDLLEGQSAKALTLHVQHDLANLSECVAHLLLENRSSHATRIEIQLIGAHKEVVTLGAFEQSWLEVDLATFPTKDAPAQPDADNRFTISIKHDEGDDDVAALALCLTSYEHGRDPSSKWSDVLDRKNWYEHPQISIYAIDNYYENLIAKFKSSRNSSVGV